MKIKKLMMPLVAIVSAVGMAFATVDHKPEPKPEPIQARDYVLMNGNWRAIPEQSCQGSDKNCQVRFSETGQAYDVYDERSLETVKRSPDNQDPAIITTFK